METTISKKAAAFALALVMACALCATSVTQAFAADTEAGTTVVSLKADDSQLSVTVPTVLAGTIDAATGNIAYADDEFAFENNSVFGVHVSGITATATGTYNLVSTGAYGADTTANTLKTTAKPGNGTPVDLKAPSFTPTAEWNIASDGTLLVSFEGQIKNLDNITSTAVPAFNIVWTVAAGSLS